MVLLIAALGMEGLLGPKPGLRLLTQPSVGAECPLSKWGSQGLAHSGEWENQERSAGLYAALADLSLAPLSWGPPTSPGPLEPCGTCDSRERVTRGHLCVATQ